MTDYLPMLVETPWGMVNINIIHNMHVCNQLKLTILFFVINIEWQL